MDFFSQSYIIICFIYITAFYSWFHHGFELAQKKTISLVKGTSLPTAYSRISLSIDSATSSSITAAILTYDVQTAFWSLHNQTDTDFTCIGVALSNGSLRFKILQQF